MTKQLTNYQKEFILNYFFKDEKYAGWRNIGVQLLESGECVVAGKICIWVGGIGNFIKTEVSKKFVGCLLYKFDLIEFLSSQWYNDINASYSIILLKELNELKEKLKEKEIEYNEVSDL
jgi:hypothetical protein